MYMIGCISPASLYNNAMQFIKSLTHIGNMERLCGLGLFAMMFKG